MLERQPHLELNGLEAAAGAALLEGDGLLAGGTTSSERRRLFPGIRRRDRKASSASLESLSVELARARRYGRPLALIGISRADGGPLTADAVAAIRPLVRTIDTVWASAACLYVLLPESDEPAAGVVLGRLRRERSRIFEGAVSNVAVFPSDALTARALLDAAGGRTPRVAVEPPASFGGASPEPSPGFSAIATLRPS